jgi:hypothetical protein
LGVSRCGDFKNSIQHKTIQHTTQYRRANPAMVLFWPLRSTHPPRTTGPPPASLLFLAACRNLPTPWPWLSRGPRASVTYIAEPGGRRRPGAAAQVPPPPPAAPFPSPSKPFGGGGGALFAQKTA